MRILVCGDRNWTDSWMIRMALEGFPKGTVVIEGEASGADTWGRRAAESLGFEVLPFPANWDKYSKAAGPIRNRQMLDEGKPDLVLAFHDDIESSKGTKDCIKAAEQRGIPYIVLYHS